MSVDLHNTYKQEPNAYFATEVNVDLAWDIMEKALKVMNKNSRSLLHIEREFLLVL